MAEELDPAWEYWEPDPEIAELMSSDARLYDPEEEYLKQQQSPYWANTRGGFWRPEEFLGTGPTPPPKDYKPPREPRQKERKSPRELTPVLTVNCDQCGAEVTTTNPDRRFCNQTCYTTYVSTHRELVKPCKRCGRAFPKTNSRRAYCSRACENPRGRKRTLMERICQGCKQPFQPDRTSRLYCSADCRWRKDVT